MGPLLFLRSEGGTQGGGSPRWRRAYYYYAPPENFSSHTRIGHQCFSLNTSIFLGSCSPPLLKNRLRAYGSVVRSHRITQPFDFIVKLPRPFCAPPQYGSLCNHVIRPLITNAYSDYTAHPGKVHPLLICRWVFTAATAAQARIITQGLLSSGPFLQTSECRD